jgi:hypothetical protein
MNDEKRWRLSDLAGVTDIAGDYEVTQSTVSNWILRYDDFPEPLAMIGGRKVFSRKQIRAWHAETFNRPQPKALRHKKKHY